MAPTVLSSASTLTKLLTASRSASALAPAKDPRCLSSSTVRSQQMSAKSLRLLQAATRLPSPPLLPLLAHLKASLAVEMLKMKRDNLTLTTNVVIVSRKEV